MKLVLYGNPATKKNSMQIFKNHKTGQRYPINLKCVYYRKTKRCVDLNNLLAATCDILKDYGVITDDNYKIVKSVDGSRVLFDKERPRVEIEIERVEQNGEKLRKVE